MTDKSVSERLRALRDEVMDNFERQSNWVPDLDSIIAGVEEIAQEIRDKPDYEEYPDTWAARLSPEEES